MKARTLLGLVVCLFLGANQADDKANKDLQSLEGTWQVLSLETDGQKVPEDEAKQYMVFIKGNKYTLKMKESIVNEGTLKVDGAKKPKTMDINPTQGDSKGETMLGIYEEDGDTQKVCWGPPGKPRPTKFSSEGGYTLLVYKKQKK